MAKPLVIVSHQLPPEWLASLHESCEVLIGPPTSETPDLTPALRAQLPNATGLLTMLTVAIDDTLLATAPSLKVVSNMAVGVDNVDLAACTARGIPVGHTPGVLTDSTAELTLALMLAGARRIPEAAVDAKAGRWDTWNPTAWLGFDLAGSTLGIIGMGKIGRSVAERARAFEMNILYHNRTRQPDAEQTLGVHYAPLDDLLRQSDVVSLHCPLTEATHHLIDAAAFGKMKPTALLVNMARGPVVHSADLLDALRNGQIAAAALDVTDPEPLPASDPLFAQPNCLIVPHIGSATLRTRQRMAELACQNVLAGVHGRPLLFQANG